MAKSPDKKPSILVPLLVVTLVGAGGGFAVAQRLSASASPHAVAVSSPGAGSTKIVDIPPVVTGLASPEGAFIRVQVALVVEMNAKAIDANLLSTDIVAYLRTVPLERLAGPSGLQHLREDLRERADIRFAGQVRDIVLHDLVVQ